jgi:hypothetical protein
VGLAHKKAKPLASCDPRGLLVLIFRIIEKIPPGRSLGIFSHTLRGKVFGALRAKTFSRIQEPGSDLLWHAREGTRPSALSVFTSEFGMGSGGSRSLWPPGKLVKIRKFLFRRLSRSSTMNRFILDNQKISTGRP